MFCSRPSFPVYLVLTLVSNELQSPRKSSWMASRIPGELLESIGKCLNTRTDVSRFRAVCKSLRSSIPRLEKQLQFPIKVLIRNTNGSNTTFTLTESIVFHLAPPRDDPHKRGWLVKVEEGKYGETRMLHPLSQFVVGRLPHSFPKVFNLLEFRVFEYARVYSIHEGGWWDRNNKVALSMNLGFPAIMIIVDGVLYHGKLDVYVNNCIEVSQLDQDQYYDYEDVIFYEGKFYAVCRDGQAVVVDSCLNVKVVAPPILACSGGDHKKSLVESSGELLLVDRYPSTMGEDSYLDKWLDIELKFKVFKLNTAENQWIEVHERDALSDRILLVGDDSCFSVSARDFPGCKGNSIYFSNFFYMKNNMEGEFGGMFSEMGVFRLDFGSHLPLTYYPSCDNIFCPPPTWTWLSSKEKKRKKKIWRRVWVWTWFSRKLKKKKIRLRSWRLDRC